MKREIDKLDLSEEDKLGRVLGMRSEEEGLKLKGLEKMPLCRPQTLSSHLCSVNLLHPWKKVWTCSLLTQENNTKQKTQVEGK